MTETEYTPHYSPLRRRLHWIVAVLVGIQYLWQDSLGATMAMLGENRTPDAGQFLVITLHTWGGLLLAALVIWRIRLRLGEAHAERVPVSRLAAAQHWLLYVTLAVMSATGALHYYDLLDAGADWHRAGKWLLGALVLLHGLAALWHHLVRRDQVLIRMLRGG